MGAPALALFGRTCVVTVGTLKIRDLRVRFDIKRTLKKDPNTCELTLYNLSEKSRKDLQNRDAWLASGHKGVPVTVEAGYGTRTAVLFKGDLREVISRREGPDWVTTLSSGDGEKAVRGARATQGFRPAVTPQIVIAKLAKDLGVGVGNAITALGTARLADVGFAFQYGVAMSGTAAEQLDRIFRSAGFEWSIQDGEIQALKRGSALLEMPVLLSSKTGLVGVPGVDNKGELSCRALIQPDLVPGKKLVLQSNEINGAFRIEETVHQGDTHGSDWYVDIKGKEVKLV